MKGNDVMSDNKWNDTEKGILKRMLRGLNVVDAIKEQRFVEGIIGLLICAGILLAICGGIFVLIDDKKKEKCIHENYNKDVIVYDFENSRVVTECDFCGKEIYLEANVTARVYEESTCTKKGLRTEYWEVLQESGHR